MVFLDKSHRIAAVVGVMAGIQRQTNERWVRFVQELLDLLLALDV